MAGKFIRTSNLQILPDFVDKNVKSSIYDNPYYLFNNASHSICTYYNINTTMTTLDESTRGNYAELSPDSPIRYNKINDFALYGINKIEPALDIGEYGLESDTNGDAIILPKTIIPYPGDFFVLKQIKEPYMFRVTSVNPNTLETGAVLYKINYVLASSDGVEHIDPQVVKEYNFSISNYGSNFGCLIELNTHKLISEIEKYTVMLKDYFIQIFYDNKIQSFSYRRHGAIKVYDPYLIEFIIRNSILKGSTEYMHVAQQMYLPSTFGIDYDRTFFSTLEDKDLTKHYCKCAGNLLLCTQKLSLLYAYPEDYYFMEYNRLNTKLHVIDIFNDAKFIEKIKNNERTNNILKDIIIGYFNGEEITSSILEKIKHIDFMENEELYYLIPFSIYCMEKYILSLL